MDPIYPVIYIDAVHFSVKDSGIVKKRAAYIVLGTNKDGVKEVLGMYIGDAESSKYWLSILNELKYVSYKDKKEFASDLKSVYLSNNEEQASH